VRTTHADRRRKDPLRFAIVASAPLQGRLMRLML